MATNGRAIRVIREPKIETVAAVQIRTNAPFRQSGDEKGLGMSGEDSDPIGPWAVAARLRYTATALVRQNPRTTRPAGAVTEPEPVLTTMES
jgi:hypothetical protein